MKEARMRKREHTREILQAKADRYCEEFRARGFIHVPDSGVRVFTVGALHDAAIGAPPGFSRRYASVGARAKDGQLTVYVKLMVSEFTYSPSYMLLDEILNHVVGHKALKYAETHGMRNLPGIADYGCGLAFVSEGDPVDEAMWMRVPRAAELPGVNDDTWETDPTLFTLVEHILDREAYPQDYAPDDA
jgi:hypothetical protein